MDRQIFYRNELLFEDALMLVGRNAYQALGMFALDVLGAATVVAGFPCAPTSPASLSFKLGPGRLYTLKNLDDTAMGQTLGVGGLAADTNADHQIMKQGFYADTRTLGPLTPPGTAGQSQVFLVEAQFQETDDTATLTQFYNVAAPGTPTTATVTPARRDIVAVQIKPGVAAATGSQVAPSADTGWTPLWTITLANGDTTITAGKIALAAGAPFVSIGNPVPVREPIVKPVITAGVLTIDFALGNVFVVADTANITSFSFLNLPPAGLEQEVTLIFVSNGTAHTQAWPTTGTPVRWIGATAPAAAPTLASTAGYKSTCVLVARDGLSVIDASFSGISAT